MPTIPLICPRCGHPQLVVPSDSARPILVVHEGTGREACEPGDLARAPEDVTLEEAPRAVACGER